MPFQQNHWHVFSEHLLRTVSDGPVLNQRQDALWPSYLFVFVFLLLVFLKISSFTKVSKVIQASFSLQAFRQSIREEYNPFKLYGIILSIVYMISFSFLIYKYNRLAGLMWTSYSSLAQFLFILMVVLFFIVLKYLFVFFLSRFSDRYKVLNEYTNNSFMSFQALGLLLFPCMVLAELSKLNPMVFLSVATVIITIMMLVKWYRGIVFSLVDNRLGFLQIIAYFCSLEVLPVLVVAKFLIETF